MSNFWDKLKPTRRDPAATAVDLNAGNTVVTMAWDDGVVTRSTAQALRQNCPCAQCVDEWTNKRTLDVDRIPADMKVVSVHPVGNYAVAFQFGDGHNTGIFNWRYLREVSERNPAP